MFFFVPFVALFVDVVQPGKLPTRSGFFEMINDDFVSTCVWTGYAEVPGIVRVSFRLRFSEARRCVGLFVEDLFVALGELRFRSYARYAVRHSNRELRQPRDRLDIAFADRSFKSLPERVERGVRRLTGD